jgi:hypothetical protein
MHNDLQHFLKLGMYRHPETATDKLATHICLCVRQLAAAAIRLNCRSEIMFRPLVVAGRKSSSS